MKLETAAKVKYGVWGLICGAVIAMIVGFAGGGWTTSGTTQTMSKEAVLASQAAICVAQFMKQPNHEKKLKELGEVSSWQRAEVIEKGRWDKMPGQQKAGYAVARACAGGLDLLTKKSDRYGARHRLNSNRMSVLIAPPRLHPKFPNAEAFALVQPRRVAKSLRH